MIWSNGVHRGQYLNFWFKNCGDHFDNYISHTDPTRWYALIIFVIRGCTISVGTCGAESSRHGTHRSLQRPFYRTRWTQLVAANKMSDSGEN
jgi:hypothetical protein